MKKTLYKSLLPYLMIAVALISGCVKEEEPIIPEVIPEATEVNSFIWNGLSDYYLWNSQVAGLTNSKYAKKDSLNAFLNTYTDPQKLFTSLLYKYKEVDKWSFLVDDSKEIDDWISGISETAGYYIYPVGYGTSKNVLGLVLYVYKGSPADKAGIRRGDIIVKVNDQQITESNYGTLLYNTLVSKLSFANIIDYTIVPNNRTVNVTAIEMQENPINKDTIFIFNNQKIGYLVYNGFNSDFDIQLNDVFKKFKVANIDRLILDLRYNGGGSVQSSIYLASMIYGTDATKVYAKAKYNSGLQSYFVSEYGLASLNDNFTTFIDKTDKNPVTTINTLNLNKIHIIVSDNTASASEMLINGLRPYMNVTVVGINTNGKYTGSTTVRDWNERGTVNPNHKWAMQPIVVKYANSRDESDYVNGLTPNIISEEDFANLLPFGDPNETLLSLVLSDIKGIPVTGMVLKSAKMGLRKVSDSRDFKPFANEMYINPDKFQNLKKQ
ncbi:MAG: S41 family peptidase [Bacteroidota bacterium]|nr:S41 family peptidase [Bacteroidota bacterium]